MHEKCTMFYCPHQMNGVCSRDSKRTNCPHAKAVGLLQFIIGTQKLCALCANDKCKNSDVHSVCQPVWNGDIPELKED